MSDYKSAIDYVNAIAPEHERTSCSDDNLDNAAINIDDHRGHGRCYRCTLLQVASFSFRENS